MSQDPYGRPVNPDPQAGLPAVGYTAFDPITGQPMSSPDVYPQQSTGGQPVYQAPPTPAGYAAAPPPGYPYPPQPPMGYVAMPPGYPPMYGYPPQRPARPGGATASAVLQFVQSAFVLIGAFYTIVGGAALSTLDRRYRSEYESQFTVVGIVTLAIGGLLIAGGVSILNRRVVLTYVSCLGSLAVSVYWVIFFSGFGDWVEFGIWLPMTYAILPIIALALGAGSGVRQWAAARAQS